jgi:hypothetical protein
MNHHRAVAIELGRSQHLLNWMLANDIDLAGSKR